MSRRPLLSWLFALALLFGQAAAFAHALAHLHPHESALPDTPCEVCVAQAQLGSAAPPGVVTVAMVTGDSVRAPGAAPVCADLVPRPACARAPPVL